MTNSEKNRDEFNLSFVFQTNAVPNRWNLQKIREHLAPSKGYMINYIVWDTYTP